MAALEDAVASLQQAISDANSRFTNVAEVERALSEERARYEALVTAEAAEDVQQDQELANARARTDELIANMAQLPEQLSAMAAQVNQLGTAAAQTTGTDEPATTEPPLTRMVVLQMKPRLILPTEVRLTVVPRIPPRSRLLRRRTIPRLR
jgi:chromosome segregation ATPase